MPTRDDLPEGEAAGHRFVAEEAAIGRPNQASGSIHRQYCHSVIYPINRQEGVDASTFRPVNNDDATLTGFEPVLPP